MHGRLDLEKNLGGGTADPGVWIASLRHPTACRLGLATSRSASYAVLAASVRALALVVSFRPGRQSGRSPPCFCRRQWTSSAGVVTVTVCRWPVVVRRYRCGRRPILKVVSRPSTPAACYLLKLSPCCLLYCYIYHWFCLSGPRFLMVLTSLHAIVLTAEFL